MSRLDTSVNGLLLCVQRPNAQVEEFYLSHGLTIGRTQANGIALTADETVSRTHARIECFPNGVARLICLESQGRVQWEGALVSELTLVDGLTFLVGNTEFTCKSVEQQFTLPEKPEQPTCPHCKARQAIQTEHQQQTCTQCHQLLLAIHLTTEPESTLLVPACYGKYTATDFLLRNSLGVVLKAQQVDNVAAVAIWLILPQYTFSQTSSEAYKQALLRQRNVCHPNVARIHEVNRTGRYNFVVYEWVDGFRLQQVIDQARQRKNLVSYQSTQVWFRQICAGLAELHAAGVIHRQLTPEMILLDRSNQVKLISPGIARNSVGSQSHATVTAAEMRALRYTAPEQQSAHGNVDARADLYSLGAIFYELLVGNLPIGKREAPSAVNKTVPHHFDRLVLKLLAAEPAKRFANVAEVLEALEPPCQAKATVMADATLPTAGNAQSPLVIHSKSSLSSEPAPIGATTQNSLDRIDNFAVVDETCQMSFTGGCLTAACLTVPLLIALLTLICALH